MSDELLPGRSRCPLDWRCFPLFLVTAVVLIYMLCPLTGGSPCQAAASGKSKDSLQLLRISPSGEDVPTGRQIVFQFDRPVVPLGRMERKSDEIPIAIEPGLKCQWRWLNSSTLACQLDEQNALLPATRYKVKVQPGITTEEGKTLAKTVTHTFVTERPKISSTWFKTWIAPGSPQIGVRFNQPVQQESVAAHLFFKTGKETRVAAELSDDPDFVKSSDFQTGLVWLVSPKEELPGAQSVSLKVEPGIVPLEGPESSVDKRTIDEFHTFPKFVFIGIQCETKEGEQFTIGINEKGPSRQRCNPAREISLVFSSPVLKEELEKAIAIEPALESGQPGVDPWENVYSYSELSSPHEANETYSISLPNYIKPYSDYLIRAGVESIKDEFNRPLQAAFEIAFKTSHLPPDFFLFKPMAVLETDVDSEAPLAVTNLDKMQANYAVIHAGGKQANQVKDIGLPKALDVPTKVPVGVRDLLGRSSGLVTGQLTPTPPVPDKDSSEGWFFAQVTPFAVHAKLGHYNTTVWITDLKTGQPVPGVNVKICKDTFADFGDNQEVLTEGEADGDGIASMAGIKKIDPDLKLLWAYKPDEPRLFVRCQKGDDFAVMPLTYDFRVDAEGANREYIPDWIRPQHGHIRSWGATAQGIYKVGDTVEYKIYVRDQNNRRFVLPPGIESSQAAAYTLKVIDPMDKAVFERKEIKLSEFGACDGEFSIPSNGAVGWYRFELSAPFSDHTWEPLRVLVSDFTPAPFKVTVDLNGKQFAVGDQVKVTTQAALHAGGPFAGAAVRVTAILDAQTYSPENPKLRNFQFDVLESSEQRTPPTQTLHQTEGVLSDQGLLETEFKLVESSVLYGRLTMESAVRDDRGKFVANRATADYIGRDRYVGLLQQDWVLEQDKPAVVQAAVVDHNGAPAAGTSIALKVQREETKAARVRDAGDAYVTQYVQEWVDEEGFQLTSELDPVKFEFIPKRAGSYRITAQIKDSLERVQATTIERWCVGGGQVLWRTTPGNMMNVYPEKNTYRIGETARFLAQNPYPGAKALITVERFGVLQSWVKTFQNSTEIIEVPVLPDYLPGFYLSVLVMSPRVEKTAAEDAEDLGKPAFSMGYVQVPVDDPYKEIEVLVKPQQEVYKPGDTVTVELEAHPRHPVPGEPAAPIELAVTVLDEAVFDLLMQGKSAFDPYEGFYSLDSLDLANYNLIMQLVGRQKLEKKGANPGGGGGPDLSMRSIFKFVSYWNPSLPVDAEGKARVEFTVPDNLTGWRVLAMAASPEDLMGLGDALFKVNQSTEIRPILPNQVTAGDSFDAGFTILNRTEHTRTLEIALQARGPIRSEQGEQSEIGRSEVRSTQQLTLEPFKRATVRMPLRTTADGEIIFTVTAGDDMDMDGLQAALSVQKEQSPVTVAAYGSTIEDKAAQRVSFPEAMRADSGELIITTAPTVIGGIEGSFQYLSKYPYDCWEQKLTVGVAAAIYERLKPYLNEGFVWPESEQLPGNILALSAEYQAPNGGMTFYVPKDEYVSPYLSAYTALAFGWLRDFGHAPPQNTEERLHEYLLSLLKRDVTPDFYSKGMSSTIRAVTLAALAQSAKIKQGDVERFAGHTAEMSLFGKDLYLQALL
ncbi:MAG: alpha-2-macroglobulin family protein, partial [Desulforhabdus sp.]|nr:alpha-2-macroglobulin family protein [Desulforhabdus sp.]